jgi:hypothetical protein
MITLESAPKHARRAPRFKVFQPASIECDGNRHRAHILDLSSSGARLHCADMPSVGSYLSLTCGGFTVRGRIVWRRDQRLGVEFHFPLPDAHVRYIIEYVTSE